MLGIFGAIACGILGIIFAVVGAWNGPRSSITRITASLASLYFVALLSLPGGSSLRHSARCTSLTRRLTFMPPKVWTRVHSSSLSVLRVTFAARMRVVRDSE